MADTYKFKGKAFWAKIYDENKDTFRGNDQYVIDIYPETQEVFDLYAKSGIQGKVREDKNGKFLRFKRPVTKLIKGATHRFSGPEVLDADDNKIVYYEKDADAGKWVRHGEPVLIGNGSVVEVTVVTYPTAMGIGQRLQSVKIIDLVEFTGSGFEDTIVTDAPDETDEVKVPWRKA